MSVFYADNRWDIVEYMWRNKKPILVYHARSFQVEEEAWDQFIDRRKLALEADIDKYTTLEKYFVQQYGIDKAEWLFSQMKFSDQSIGNSDTLALTLQLKLLAEDEDVSSNSKVVITGSMDELGNILPVGEVAMKAITADKADADYFMVPMQHYEEAMNAIDTYKLDLEIKPMETIEEAYNFLQEIE